jgi:nucleoside-diphosphate-sugar epimerase
MASCLVLGGAGFIGSHLADLGWAPRASLAEGLRRTHAAIR